MPLTDAIEAYNQTAAQPIVMTTTRDGRVTARLPRANAEVLVGDSMFKKDVRVSARDIALVCQEARLAMAPALALLQAALDVIPELTEA